MQKNISWILKMFAGAPCQWSTNLATGVTPGPPTEGVWVQITDAPKYSFKHYFLGAAEAAPQGDTSPTRK
jgi:hypothetical protein